MIFQSVSFLAKEYALEVVIFHASNELPNLTDYERRLPGVRFHLVELPGVLGIARGIFALPILTPFQARLYFSPAIRDSINDVCRGADITIFDMARTAVYISHVRGPSVVDFDDLLSLRYRRQQSSGNNANVLGSYSERVPAVLRGTAQRLGATLLYIEAYLMERYEVRTARQAKLCLFVSEREAALFAEKHDISAFGVPQAVELSTAAVGENLSVSSKSDRKLQILFLGNMKAPQNYESALYVAKVLVPTLRASGLEFTVNFVGSAPESLVHLLSGSAECAFHGFVDDLGAFMRDMDVHVAPIWSGTGIKTKVLDSFQHGVPTVTTTLGIEGLSVRNGIHVLVADSAIEIAASIERLAQDPGLGKELARNALAFLRDQHDWAKVQSKFLKLIGSALQ